MHPCRVRIVFPALMWAATAWAEEAPLVDLALEDLARLEVATVSRKAQKLSETSAAVTVLTAEDIRRSGARSVPEALREVPGVSVTQIGAGRWAVGVRGYAGRFSNKLLVLIDGRSVYSPLFSGVFWEALDVMLEDVERIEVVRGPGASLWGANAVNGVINIVTRKATASRGGLLSMRLDNQGHPAVAVRQGVELGGAGALRVFAKGNELAESRSASGESGVDHIARAIDGVGEHLSRTIHYFVVGHLCLLASPLSMVRRSCAGPGSARMITPPRPRANRSEPLRTAPA